MNHPVYTGRSSTWTSKGWAARETWTTAGIEYSKRKRESGGFLELSQHVEENCDFVVYLIITLLLMKCLSSSLDTTHIVSNLANYT